MAPPPSPKSHGKEYPGVIADELLQALPQGLMELLGQGPRYSWEDSLQIVNALEAQVQARVRDR